MKDRGKFILKERPECRTLYQLPTPGKLLCEVLTLVTFNQFETDCWRRPSPMSTLCGSFTGIALMFKGKA